MAVNSASDLLGHIRNSISAFHATELAIANCILLDPVQVSRMNISKLADHSDTSVASVVRFSKAIGYKGFPEFRMALEDDVRVQHAVVTEFDIRADDAIRADADIAAQRGER